MSTVEDRIGHRFANPELLARALTHSSEAERAGAMLSSNERLEFVGDRVLALCIAEWLAERFPQEREGDLAKRLAVLVAAPACAEVAERLALGPEIRIPRRYRATGMADTTRVLADALEAVLGAVFLDGGLDPARALVRREWAGLVEASARPPMSAKSRLQEWALGCGAGLPAYRLVSAEGPPHAPHFVVAVSLAGREAAGEGASKRAAEQQAAQAWLDAQEPPP
jgi:ribonuclease-3